MLTLRLHSQWMAVRPTRIYATGGASVNNAILQVMADVLGCPVRRIEVAKSAVLGAALRAAHGCCGTRIKPAPWPDVVRGFTDPIPDSEVKPDPAACGFTTPSSRNTRGLRKRRWRSYSGSASRVTRTAPTPVPSGGGESATTTPLLGGDRGGCRLSKSCGCLLERALGRSASRPAHEIDTQQHICRMPLILVRHAPGHAQRFQVRDHVQPDGSALPAVSLSANCRKHSAAWVICPFS